MEFTGRIIKALEPRGGVSARTGNPWKTQDFVIEENIGQFPKRMMFNVFGEENINRFNIQEGQEYTVHFDVNAREFNGRWFNDIRAWNVVPSQSATAPAPQSAAVPMNQPLPQSPISNNIPDDTSDLPF